MFCSLCCDLTIGWVYTPTSLFAIYDVYVSYSMRGRKGIMGITRAQGDKLPISSFFLKASQNISVPSSPWEESWSHISSDDIPQHNHVLSPPCHLPSSNHRIAVEPWQRQARHDCHSLAVLRHAKCSLLRGSRMVHSGATGSASHVATGQE